MPKYGPRKSVFKQRLNKWASIGQSAATEETLVCETVSVCASESTQKFMLDVTHLNFMISKGIASSTDASLVKVCSDWNKTDANYNFLKSNTSEMFFSKVCTPEAKDRRKFTRPFIRLYHQKNVCVINISTENETLSDSQVLQMQQLLV